MEKILALANKNHARALEIIEQAGLVQMWESIGATVNIVGSVKTGLLMTHLDIDLHIYSAPLDITASFTAMAKLAANKNVKKIECINLMHTQEECIEWHAWYEDMDKQLWQLDMIHILKGSFFDGHAEKLAARVAGALTPDTRSAILRLKYDTPATAKVTSVEYYKAVIQDGVRTYLEFAEWRKNNPAEELMMWLP